MATIEAVYEGGLLRPLGPIDLPDGSHVTLFLVAHSGERHRKTPTEILDEIAALPIEGKTDQFSGEDHDSVLYPKEGSV
jgi:predicted DNA-binding antitoxin AbrB/MazE fold protein